MIRRPPRSTLSLHDALPICRCPQPAGERAGRGEQHGERGEGEPHDRVAERQLLQARAEERHHGGQRSEEHTSELQSRLHLVCRLLLEKKKKKKKDKNKKNKT